VTTPVIGVFADGGLKGLALAGVAGAAPEDRLSCGSG
jgi:hypothetical protein